MTSQVSHLGWDSFGLRLSWAHAVSTLSGQSGRLAGCRLGWVGHMSSFIQWASQTCSHRAAFWENKTSMQGHFSCSQWIPRAPQTKGLCWETVASSYGRNCGVNGVGYRKGENGGHFSRTTYSTALATETPKLWAQGNKYSRALKSQS